MLTIRQTSVLRGPSIWAPVPTIVLEIDTGVFEERLRRETPVFFDRLTALVPSLSDYGAVVRQPEGGLRRLLLDRLATSLQNLASAEVIRALDLKNLTDLEVSYAQTHSTSECGVYTVVYEYRDQEVGLAAGKLAVRLLNHLLMAREPDFFVKEFNEKIVSAAKRNGINSYITLLIVDAAKRRGIRTEQLNVNSPLVQLGDGAYQRRISSAATTDTGSLATKVASNKALASRLLREAGLPVPRNAEARTADEAAKAAQHIGYPVVVKPRNGNRSRGVTVNLRNDKEVYEAYAFAVQEVKSNRVVVEEFVSGRNYRILVIDNQIVSVTERGIPHVVGNGKNSLNELIEIMNADPRRGDGADKILAPITVDDETHAALLKQNLKLDDVPETGQYVQLRTIPSSRTGGINADRTDNIHPENAEIARQAALVIGLDVAGIDFITPDISRSVNELGGAINEVNSQPGLHMQTYPHEGQPRDVAMAIINMLYPPGQPVRVPIVAVTGTNGQATTSGLIAHILTATGKRVGLASADGLYVAGTRIAPGDQTSWTGARNVLRNPAIDIAVLETSPAGILDSGLGFDRCDVAVVTGVCCQDLGIDDFAPAEELTRTQAVVPRSVVPEGASVLNADDNWTVRMTDTAGGEVIFFSMDSENPVIRDHLRRGGRAIVRRESADGETVTLLEGTAETSLLPVREILDSSPQPHIRVDIRHVMAAAAAALAQGVSPPVIQDALRTFPLNGA